MASLSGGVSHHRTGSSARSSTTVPVEHLQTIQSGIQADWEGLPTPTLWYNRNDSVKANYDGSAMNLPIQRRFKRKIGLYDSQKADVWRAAVVELAATTGLTFLSIAACLKGNVSTTTLALLQALVYSLAILAATPISGGHLNPAITLTTFLTGQASLVRSLLYMFAQFGGGILGSGAILYLSPQAVRTQYHMGGCLLQPLPEGPTWVGTGDLGHKQGLLAEGIFTFIMLFIVYGVGFDSRSVVVTFPIVSPFIIGGVIGVLGFISQGLGYAAAMNPARCLGPAVMQGSRLWEPLFVFVVGPLAAAVAAGVLQLALHQVNAAEFGPVLPLNFFQMVTPDNQRPGFGPRGAPVVTPVVEHDATQPAAAAASSDVLRFIPQPVMSPGRSEKLNLVLHIKALMQPSYGSESIVSAVDFPPRCDGNLAVAVAPAAAGGCIDVAALPSSSDSEKDR